MSVRQLSAPLQKLAESELNEKASRAISDVQAIRQWLSKQPHLQSVRLTDQWLLAFLRGCKFSLERTKEKLDMYYTVRSLIPELFSNRDPLDPDIQNILKLGTFLPVKNCASCDSTRICLVILGNHDPSKYHLTDLMKVFFMITDILRMEDDNFMIAGQELVIDLKGVGMNVIGQFTPALARKVTLCVEKAMPVRQKGSHILNTPSGFETVYTMFRTFLSEKLKNRFKVHNQNYAAMHAVIPKKVLPLEYGGEDGTVVELIAHWKAKVESYREWFLNEEKQRSEESLRPGQPKTQSNMFGVDGSFRKLDFD